MRAAKAIACVARTYAGPHGRAAAMAAQAESLARSISDEDLRENALAQVTGALAYAGQHQQAGGPRPLHHRPEPQGGRPSPGRGSAGLCRAAPAGRGPGPLHHSSVPPGGGPSPDCRGTRQGRPRPVFACGCRSLRGREMAGRSAAGTTAHAFRSHGSEPYAAGAVARQPLRRRPGQARQMHGDVDFGLLHKRVILHPAQLRSQDSRQSP